MGKEAVRNQLHVFLDDVMEYALQEFKPLAVIGLGFLPGNSIAKLLLSPLIKKELNVIKITLQNEFNTILDLSEDMKDGDSDPSRYRDRFLANDFFYQNYHGDRADEFEEVLEQRLEEVAEDLEPLLDAEADDFWEALVETYERGEAKDMLTYHFSFTEKLAKDFGDGMKLTFKLGLIKFDYTNEAVRVLPYAESSLREQILERLDEEYERHAVVEVQELEKENKKLRKKIDELERRNRKLNEKVENLQADGGDEGSATEKADEEVEAED
ncbi:MAG: hypothetical protein ACLFMT_02130 [Halobacteriales archaeon]